MNNRCYSKNNCKCSVREICILFDTKVNNLFILINLFILVNYIKLPILHSISYLLVSASCEMGSTDITQYALYLCSEYTNPSLTKMYPEILKNMHLNPYLASKCHNLFFCVIPLSLKFH